MTAPVHSAPSVRPAPGRTPDAGGPDSAAPFASALDDVLAQSRPAERPAASPSGADRRRTPDDQVDRAAERTAERSDRAEDRLADKAGHAARRAAAKADRAADRADDKSDDKADRADKARDVVRNAAAASELPLDRTSGESGGSATGQGPAPAVDPTPQGVPAAFWALMTAAAVPATAAAPSPTGAVPATNGPIPGLRVAEAAVIAGPVAPTVPVLPVATGTPVQAADLPVPSSQPLVAPAAAAAGATQPPVTALDLSVVPAASGPAPTASGPAPTAAPAAASAAALAVDVVPAGPTPPSVRLDAATTAAQVVATPPAGASAAPTPVASSTGADDATGTVAIATAPGGAVASTAAGTTGDTASADTGSPGQNGSATPAPVDGVVETPTTNSLAAPAPSTTVTAPAVSATGDAAALPAGSQVARHVAVLRGAPDGSHTMTLVLRPETLGPVEVQVTVSKGSVDLTLRGAHEHGRAALLDSLPDLRRDLEIAGLACTRLEVDRDTGGSRLSQQPSQQQAQQQGFGDRSGQPDRGERSRPWLRAADISGSGPTPPPQRSTSSGVDVLA